MHRISLFSLGLLLLALLTAPLANPALAATSQPGGPSKPMVCPSSITVTSTDDSGAGTLRQAIADICDGGTIDFDQALAGKTIALASTLTIERELTIDGTALAVPVTLSGDSDGDGDGDVRVLFLNYQIAATLDGVTIAYGMASDSGAGIASYGDLTIKHSIITKNVVSHEYSGGAIFNYGSMTIANSRISNNQAESAGAISSPGSLSISDSTLFNNSATNGGGGAISSSGSLTISNSTFTRNIASYEGGAIFVTGGTISVTGSTFVNNNGGSYAGAIDIASNLGVQGTVSNSTFSGNTASAMGGAIYNGDTLTLTNSTFSGNASGLGAALMNVGTLNYANTLIANSGDVAGCFNADFGAATIGTNLNNWVEDGSCAAALSGGTALDVLGDNGGATQTFALLPGSGAIDAGDDATCAAAPVGNLDQRGVSRPVGAHCDIGAYEYQANYIVTKAADTNDGACNADCSLREAITAANASAIIDSITFKGDYTIMLGSKLPTISDDLRIDGRGHTVVIDGNHHAILENNASLALNHLTLQHAGGNNGGALLAHSAATISDVTFDSNAVNGNGGAIYAEGLLAISDSTFSSNSSDSGGGAIENDHGMVTITNSTFSSNTSDIGGAINSVGGTVTLMNSTFSGNGNIAIYNEGTLNYANTIIANSSGADCENNGTLGTNVNNLVEDGSCSAALSGDPALGTLANNGGATKTFALAATSSAINAGNDAACLSAVRTGLDQRGYPRLLATHCDIGSYEYTVQPTVVSITRKSANPTTSSTVEYAVTFSEPVVGLDSSDFSLTSDGVSGAYAVMVSDGPTVYTVLVTTGMGSGTIKLNLLANGNIVNVASIPLDGGYTNGESYTVQRSAPTVSAFNAANITTSGGATYRFSVTFSDDLAVDATSLDSNDIRVVGPGGFNQLATLISVTPAGNGASRTATYQINAPKGAWAIADNGVYQLVLEGNQVRDTSGNAAPASMIGVFTVSIGKPIYTVSLPLVRR